VIVDRRNTWAGGVLLILLMALTLLPFASMFTTALHESGTYPNGLVWPSHPHWHNFVDAFHVANMGAIFKSSVLIVIGVVPVAVVIATMAGFALGALRVTGGQIIFLFFLLGLTLPFEGVIVPIYYEIRGMGLLNTRWAIILPLIGLYMPFGVFWMRVHFLNMPSEMTEAARVDGASTWQLFWQVQVPLARPAVVSLAILTTVWTWNQFLLAIVVVDDPTKRTMAGALGAFQGQWGTNIPLLSAGSILILAPMIIIFFIFQRHFVSALLQGSLKG
jgi:raffinose/stachyose/melibiose transport system permease protein